MSNCQLTSNYGSDNVGGILIYNDEIEGGNTYLEDLVLTGNVAVGTYGRAGGIQARGDVTLKLCNISNNLADSVGGGVVNSIESFTRRNGLSPDGNPGPSSRGSRTGNSSITIDNCLISNNNSGDVGGGVYCFDNPYLMDTTVCGNAPNQIYGGWSDNGGNVVETECLPCLGDATGDGVIDVNDVLYLISAWDTADPNADFDGDGLVDADDVLILLSHFGETCP